MRIKLRILLQGEVVRLILADRQKKGEPVSVADIAKRLRVSVQFLYLILDQKKPVSCEMQDKLRKFFRGYGWDQLFKIDEVK